METKTSAELRLSLSNLLADTLHQFIDNDGEDSESPESRLIAEDVAESILEIIGIQINPGPNEQGEIEAIMSQDMPEEFSL